MDKLFKRIGTTSEGLPLWELQEEKPTNAGKRFKKIQTIEDGNVCLKIVSHKGLNKSGHLQIKRNDKLVLAHRYIWELFNGKEIPDRLVVRHK